MSAAPGVDSRGPPLSGGRRVAAPGVATRVNTADTGVIGGPPRPARNSLSARPPARARALQ